jgi:hypothetical protein
VHDRLKEVRSDPVFQAVIAAVVILFSFSGMPAGVGLL